MLFLSINSKYNCFFYFFAGEGAEVYKNDKWFFDWWVSEECNKCFTSNIFPP